MSLASFLAFFSCLIKSSFVFLRSLESSKRSRSDSISSLVCSICLRFSSRILFCSFNCSSKDSSVSLFSSLIFLDVSNTPSNCPSNEIFPKLIVKLLPSSFIPSFNLSTSLLRVCITSTVFVSVLIAFVSICKSTLALTFKASFVILLISLCTLSKLISDIPSVISNLIGTDNLALPFSPKKFLMNVFKFVLVACSSTLNE